MKIHVDRGIRANYPNWRMMRVLHPELELIGPDTFDFHSDDIEGWIHPGQENNGWGEGFWMTGFCVYTHLYENGMLRRCFSLRDGVEICKAISADEFRMVFPHEEDILMLWNSGVHWEHVGNWVPFVRALNVSVVIDWMKIDSGGWNEHRITPLFKEHLLAKQSSLRIR